MGYNADKHPGRGTFYLSTNADSPFCGNHHIFQIKMASTAVKTAGEIAIAFPKSTIDKTFKPLTT